MTNSAVQLDAVFHALSSQPRRAILQRLTEGPCTVSELTALVNLAMPTVSKHIAVLEESDLITRVAVNRQRMCALRPWPLLAAQGWSAEILTAWEKGARIHAPQS